MEMFVGSSEVPQLTTFHCSCCDCQWIYPQPHHSPSILYGSISLICRLHFLPDYSSNIRECTQVFTIDIVSISSLQTISPFNIANYKLIFTRSPLFISNLVNLKHQTPKPLLFVSSVALNFSISSSIQSSIPPFKKQKQQLASEANTQ